MKEKRKIQDLHLGEVVGCLISLEIGKRLGIRNLNFKGSPYASYEEIAQGIRDRYNFRKKPFEEELQKREQLYLNK